MKILVGKCFGLGNAVMSIPMLEAIRSLPCVEQLDVLIGSMPDDGGASNVMRHLLANGVIHGLHTDRVPEYITYDIAIMAIPFDGRWRNGVHFHSIEVWDGRTRPDPSTTGLVSWKKHEVLYQMENAERLGYSGEVPSTSFHPSNSPGFCRDVYIGVGYKKDAESFWSKKHWGNDNFAKFVSLLLEQYPDVRVHGTGDLLDWKLSLQPIQRAVKNDRLKVAATNLERAFETLSKCGLYVGNDTGMMHVAQSMGIPCVSLFFLENSITKSAPFAGDNVVIDALTEDMSPARVLADCRKILER
jgi:ADP-heptose:LPS heptosyltransferase